MPNVKSLVADPPQRTNLKMLYKNVVRVATNCKLPCRCQDPKQSVDVVVARRLRTTGIALGQHSKLRVAS